MTIAKKPLSFFLLIAALNAPMTNLSAQSIITWVVGVGDDSTPCTRASPCRTYAGALTKTLSGGQISVLPEGGNFGAVTITTPLTLDGNSEPAETALLASGTAITVNAPSAVVVLRNLVLNGANLATTGIQLTQASQLVIENCKISGFATGISISPSTGGNIVIRNSTISNCSIGVNIAPTVTSVNVELNDLSVQECTTGVEAQLAVVDVANSLIAQNGSGLLANANSTVNCINSLFTSNTTAIQVAASSTLRISNNDFYYNTTGLSSSGGTIDTANNNREIGSTSSASPNGAIVIR